MPLEPCLTISAVAIRKVIQWGVSGMDTSPFFLHITQTDIFAWTRAFKLSVADFVCRCPPQSGQIAVDCTSAKVMGFMGRVSLMNSVS